MTTPQPFNSNNGVYMGTVTAATATGPVLQGQIGYALEVNTGAGVLTVGPVYSFQHQWPASELVVAWPIGTPLAFAMTAGQSVGLFTEPPAVGDCQ